MTGGSVLTATLGAGLATAATGGRLHVVASIQEFVQSVSGRVP